MIINYQRELVLSVILIVIVLVIILFTKRAIRHFSFVRAIEVNRRKVVYYLSYFFIYLIAGFVLAVIWGFDFKQIVVALSSVLAVLGVGFFAQWSILSNLTSSAILFFSHPVRIGNRIRIIDKDYDYTGLIIDISGFFLFMKTDEGKNVTVPTSIIMQKGIEILGESDTEEEEKNEEAYKYEFTEDEH